MPCWWGIRWWHRRKRRLDAETVIQALVERAPAGKFLKAVQMFWLMEGQEHWWCDCAEPDRRAYLDAFETLEDCEDLTEDL